MLWEAWRRWWNRAETTRQVVLYTRNGCHLCEEALAQLEKAQLRYRFTLSIIDVDSAPPLVQAYGNCVPVVMIEGKVRFRGQVNPVLLARLLRAPAAPEDDTPEEPLPG